MPPVAIAPSGTIATTTPTYSWYPSTRASSYNLLVQDATGAVVSESHTASELGCGSGTGTCSWTPATPLVPGTLYDWFVNATNGWGTSAWSTDTSVTAQ